MEHHPHMFPKDDEFYVKRRYAWLPTRIRNNEDAIVWAWRTYYYDVYVGYPQWFICWMFNWVHMLRCDYLRRNRLIRNLRKEGLHRLNADIPDEHLHKFGLNPKV